jgi:NAD(P)-dependent dehydrogenase (short-subunit alcohol dehydrogenase family)/acyl dehydratase/putative sterol carrier protein
MALNFDAIGKPIGPLEKDYTWKDVILYALGVGAGFDELEYVYEDRLNVIPSFSIASIFDFLAEVGISSNCDLSGVLHGEQDLIFHNPIPTEGRISTSGTITHMFDKGEGRGALVVAEGDTFHSNGLKLFTNILTVFSRKDGGFGGQPGPSEQVEFPDRAPDFEDVSRPSADQPLIYRLSGDIFSLHVDPDFAKASGFQKPIMHGLCTHGYACRAAIKNLFPGEPERMKRFRVRFSKTLYPGEPIKTQIWKIDEGTAYFRVLNADNNEVVIDRGIVEWLTPAEVERRKKLGGINFDGRVAIVTGAGAGLGRSYALELAKRGAKVVVNDLGGARDGTGGSASAADKVVEEIKALGGEAVANYDSVATAEGGRRIVDTAIQAFGKLDILVNNAGILRDKTLVKIDPETWDAVVDVHLKGAYNVTRPAMIHMREKGYGRIVMTSSSAGLFGNFGQTNYSAAKLGLIGLMNSLKAEGSKYNVKINTIVPVAATRLTEDVLPPDLFAKLKPEYVAPMVLYLCSEQCPANGGIYNAGMGYFNRAAVLTGPGAVVGDGKQPPTVEEVAAAMGKIKSLEAAEEFPNAAAAFGPMLDAFNPKKKPAAGAGDGAPTVKDVFAGLPAAFQPENASGVDVVFGFEVTGAQGGNWAVTVRDGKCEMCEGEASDPTTTFKIADQDFIKMMTGQTSPMSAYTSGKLKIGGDLMKSQLVEKLFKL